MTLMPFVCVSKRYPKLFQYLIAAGLSAALLVGAASALPPLERNNKLMELQSAKVDAVTKAFAKCYVHGEADRAKSPAYNLAKEGQKLMDSGDAQKSYDVYTKAIESLQKPEEKALMTSQDAINYRLANLYCARGLCSQKLKDPKGALSDFTAAQNCCPGYRIPYVYKARVHMENKDRLNFSRVMNVALHTPEYPPFLEKLLKTDPGYMKATEAFHTEITKNFDKMEDESQRRIFKDGKKGADASKMEKYYWNGQKLSAKSQYKEAVAEYTNAIKAFDSAAEKELYKTKAAADYKYSWNFQNRGYCYLMLKDYQKAVDDLSRAIALRPDYRENYINRGKALIILGRKKEGNADLEKASKMKPNVEPKF